MNIVVIVRTLNESNNIDRFCQCYSWADKILIADGGSIDGTTYKALQYPNTYVYTFPEKIWHTKKVFSNPRGKHINFLIRWAQKESADWIIFDDVDCVPSSELQHNGRNILENSPCDMVFAYRLYIKGNKEYYPDANIPGQSLWAWRWSPVWADEENPTVFSMHISNFNRLNLTQPNVLLHYFYPNDEIISKKMEFYSLTGDAGGAPQHPDKIFGRLDILPEYARWK